MQELNSGDLLRRRGVVQPRHCSRRVMVSRRRCSVLAKAGVQRHQQQEDESQYFPTFSMLNNESVVFRSAGATHWYPTIPNKTKKIFVQI